MMAGFPASRSRQPFGEEDHGLAIHLGPVPLAHDLEIRRAFTEWRARAPTVGLQQIGRRGEHIRHAVSEIDTAVAVIIDAVFDIGGRQKLRLADLSRIGADHVAQRKIAPLDDLQRGEKLALQIVQRGDLPLRDMIGAYAGEIGQTQFLPSSYIKYGVDYDGNGRVDLRHSLPDVLASTANLLKANGWRAGAPFGEGTTNFEVMREWNRSEVYRKTMVLFAERLTGP